MANTITQRIALTGGDEIAVQFKNLGDAGALAFKRIQDAAQATQNISKISPILDTIKAKMQQLATVGGDLGNAFSDLGSSIGTAARNVALVGGAVTGAVAGFALLEKSAGDFVNNVTNAAQAVGLTTKQFQGLQFAAAQSGLNSDQLTQSLTRLNASLGQSNKAALTVQKQQSDLSKQWLAGKISVDDYLQSSTQITENAREQITAFSRLGVATHTLGGALRDPQAVLFDLADAFHDLPDGANKSALALEIFGKAGAQMLPFISQGSAALTKLAQDSLRVAPPLTEMEKTVGNNMSNAFDVLSLAIGRTVKSIELVFGPVTTRLVTALTEFIAKNRDTFIQWAGDIADKVTPIVDDLIAVIEGRDKDVKNTFILTMRDQMLAFATATQHAITDIVIPALAALLGILDTVAQAVNGVFGTNLSGQEIAVALVITKLIGLFGVLSSAVSLVVTAVTGLVAVFGGVPVILVALAVAFGIFIANAVGGIQGLETAWTAVWTAIAAIPQAIFDGVVALAQAFVAGIATVWSGLVAATQTVATAIVDTFKAALDDVTNFFASLLSGVIATFSKIIDAAKSVGAAIQSAFSGSGDTGDNAPGFAGGGRVFGPGTGTSDSILAWVSNGEYVIPRRAVDHFGVNFFDTIRRLGDPLAALRASFRNFSMPDLIPRYAAGGLVGGLAMAGIGGGGGTPVHLHFPGGLTAGPLFGPDEVVRQLTKAASAAALASGGRKPSWFRG